MTKTKKISYFLLLFFFLNSNLFAADISRKKSLSHFWLETKIQVAQITKFINKNACEEGPDLMAACLMAIDAGMSSLPLPFKVVLEDSLADLTVGGLNLSMADEGKLSKTDYWPGDVHKARLLFKTLGHSFNWSKRDEFKKTSLMAGKIDLKEVVSFMAKQAQGQEPLIFANIMNTFLSLTLDPHSSFTPREYAVYEANEDLVINNDLNGKFGIGVSSSQLVDEGILVHAIQENGPAYKAGLHLGDIITHVEGESVLGWNFQTVRSKFQGSLGSKVRLTVLRHKVSKDLVLVRAPVVEYAADVKMVYVDDRVYAHVKLSNFLVEHTCEVLKAHLADVMSGIDYQGVILDLRNNGGGLVNMSLCLLGVFLGPNQDALMVRDLSSNVEGVMRTPEDSERLVYGPVSLLSNSMSASASEIVLCAMRENGFPVIGDRSFGKGSMQQRLGLQEPLFGEKSPLMLSTTRYLYYCPSGRTPQLNGVPADIVVGSAPGLSPKSGPREEDLYINPVIRQEKLADPLPGVEQRIANVKECVNRNSKSIGRFKNFKHPQKQADYALLVAIDSIDCQNQLGTKY